MTIFARFQILFIMCVFVALAACKSSPTVPNDELSIQPNAAAAIQVSEPTANEEDSALPPQVYLDGFNLYPREKTGWDQSGWSVITPSKDSRIIYVSSSNGDDDLGEFYEPDDLADIASPENIQPFKTIEAAMANVRDGYPDWVLLLRGDVWVVSDEINLKSGRSIQERAVFSSYGNHTERPLIKSSASVAFRLWTGTNFVVFKGIGIYGHQIDPLSDEFMGWGADNETIGVSIYAPPSVTMRAMLFEDNDINFMTHGISIPGNGEVIDLVVRRNIIRNSYSEGQHSQGMYAAHTSALLEENVFSHNGWYKRQEDDANDKEQGQATIFNHNTYFSSSKNTIFRQNIFIGASSIHNKWTAIQSATEKRDSIESGNILIEDNLYVEGEIGISAGGNTDYNTGPRWEDVKIKNNVMLAIGRKRPTNRYLAWYIDAQDWQGGLICGNYLLNNDNKEVTNILGIDISGHSSNVDVNNNTIAGLYKNSLTANSGAIRLRGNTFSNISVAGNKIQLTDSKIRPIWAESLTGLTFSDNTYYSQADESEWFGVDDESYGLQEWSIISGDTGSISSQLYFIDPVRTIETYSSSLGMSYDEFVSKLTIRSVEIWGKEFTAEAVNAYIKDGYDGASCE